MVSDDYEEGWVILDSREVLILILLEDGFWYF